MKRNRTIQSGAAFATPSLSRALRRALLLALATPIAIPVACGLEAESTTSSGAAGSTSTIASGGGGSTSQSSTGGETTDAGTGGSCDPFDYTPDAADDCGVFVRLPCGLLPGVVPGTDCYLAPNDCIPLCGELAFNCRAIDDSCIDGGVVNDSKGGINVDCATCPGGLGRAPAGLSRPRMARCQSVLGAYFARAAHLEAASVHAFRRLQADLAAHRAPASLLRAARTAERDEIRHARMTGRLARRFGAAPPRARVKPLGTRPLDDIAIENAVEGCIRETFGAAVAAFQAHRAADPEIRSLLTTIAEDESRHAALSWSIARWTRKRLSPSARARLVSECRRAISQLRHEADSPLAPALTTSAGLPSPAQQIALLGSLEQHLWPALLS